MTWRHPVLN